MTCNTWCLTLILSAVLTGLPLGDAAGADIRLLVHGRHAGDNIVYHYTIVNNGSESFNNVTIGSVMDKELGRDIPELGRLPAGWKFGREGETGTEILLDPASTTQPVGWAARTYGQEGIGFFFFEWYVPWKSSGGVKSLQTLSGFSVAVPRNDPQMRFMPAGTELKYVAGHFKVRYFLNRQRVDFRGPIEKEDTTPPVLSIAASPNVLWPPNRKDVSIRVAVSAQDDYDTHPEIKLESITANETLEEGDIVGAELGTDDRLFSLKATRAGGNPAGRIYTITYSATDGTGNKATASTTVTVPHDQR